MIKNDCYDRGMTTLGFLATGRANGKVSATPLDIGQLVLRVIADLGRLNLSAGASPITLGSPTALVAALTGWTNQDDDAHDTCDWDSLVACRNPLHPGPCKGWKGTLHSVAPGTYKQLETERVRKANERRVKRVQELKAQGKPIPRRLLEEIKPKPAPGHPAHGAQPVSPGLVNQKADLAGGQAHTAGQAVSKAAGVQVKTAPPLPLGPKGKKPTVAGRGPAFVITQPKVTDPYKLGKADKITPQEWSSLSDADRKAIRDELTAIKGRGFPPQQKKADELLARLPQTGPAPGAPTPAAAPKAPAQNVPAAPGKQTLGKATKTVSPPSSGAQGAPAAAKPPAPPAPTAPTKVSPAAVKIGDVVQGNMISGPHTVARIQLSPSRLGNTAASYDFYDTQGNLFFVGRSNAKATIVTPAPAAPSTPNAPAAPKTRGPDVADQVTRAADPASGLSVAARTFVYRKLSKDQFDSLSDATKKQVLSDLDDAAANSPSGTTRQAAADTLARLRGVSGTPSSSPSAAPAASPIKPSAPLAPGTAPTIQHAKAVADRTAPKALMAKTHLDAYDKLSKADFDSLPADTQKTIRDDLANAKAKFLDPKKQQQAADVLNRFGAKHPAPAAPSAAGNSAKGYSDPQSQAVKAAGDGTVRTDDLLKRVGVLSQASIKGLDDADRKKILGRLMFVATHPQASPDQKAKATAYGRIINSGSPAQQGLKLDHEPSLGELHAEEEKLGAAKGQASAARKAAALAAAPAGGAPRADRIAALAALPKGEFDSLSDDEKRKILNALTDLHYANSGYSKTPLPEDKVAEDAMFTLAGEHPAIFRVQQAEADFRAGKIDADQLYAEILHARVQRPGSSQNPISLQLLKEEQRIAEDNPKLPLYVRASLIANQYGAPGGTYDAISMASMKHNWDAAPRLSRFDMEKIFRSSADDLKGVHPVHAEAVNALRLNVLDTGLRGQPGVPSGSPWSTATRNEAVTAFLALEHSKPEITPERLAMYQALPNSTQGLVRRTLRERLESQTSDSAKAETWLAVRELEFRAPLTPEQRAATLAAADSFPRFGNTDIFRKLEPTQFDELPPFVRRAIVDQLGKEQTRVERNGATLTWTPSSNALKEMPAALAAHLDGKRTAYASRQARNASDVANYGMKIVEPADRVRVYGDVSVLTFHNMAQDDQDKIKNDLTAISRDSSQDLGVRHRALFNRDLILGDSNGNLNAYQITAVGSTEPVNPTTDANAFAALTALPKADFDSLDPVYREAIDERIKTLSGSDQQVLTAKFHPGQAANNPSGLAATKPSNVQPHVQEALDTIYGVHPKSHTMAHQLKTYGVLRGADFGQLNTQEQQHLLSDLSFIQTTAKGPSATKAKLLIDRFTPAGTPSGQVSTPAAIPPANAVPGQVRYATPIKGLAQAANSGKSGDGWLTLPGGRRVWGHYGAAGLLLKHTDPGTGQERYLMVQRGPAISDPGKWTFPGGASDSLETPHEGATRETIEELGLKDDVFKDALVHGDHTFTVPGSTWKYTTVAASVPTMIKPNLSTAHARAETSDAKWMTIDEIRALDKAGSLHGPIAKGLLEKNVISLYPQGVGPGTKLGQVARPGPVTKRLGRLTMPAGGRQVPANFNAWPHAHKPSTGKNLVPDKAAVNAMRQKIKQDRALYDGKTADGRLAAIGAMQGFDATPTVASKDEIDRLLATGDYIEAWRGVQGAGGYGMRGSNRSNGKSAADINEEMRTGPAYYGKGIFGNGYYLATDKRVAQQYADHTKGSVVRMLIPKTALMEKYDRVEKEAQANSSRYSKAKGATYELSTFWDPGRWGAAKGLDGIEILPHHRAHAGGGAAHVAKPGKPAYNWLNRSVLIIQKEPG